MASSNQDPRPFTPESHDDVAARPVLVDPRSQCLAVGSPVERRARHRRGLRGVGLRTVEQLHLSGVSVVVVDDDPDLRLARVVEGWGVRHVHRSARMGDGLAEAGLAHALAVICVETNELVTLEIAMRVREERPDIRLVVQLANPSVGRALERVIGEGQRARRGCAAAPSFVEVCLRQPSHEIVIADERFAVVQWR